MSREELAAKLRRQQAEYVKRQIEKPRKEAGQDDA